MSATDGGPAGLGPPVAPGGDDSMEPAGPPPGRGSRRSTAVALVAASLLVVAAVLAALALTGRIALPGHCAPADGSCLRVLFVGNSYTYANDLPGTVATLVRAGGRPIETGMLATGGATLADHAADPATASALASAPWTVVALQEQSQVPASEATRAGMFEPAARTLVGAVAAAGARPLLFETWGHRDGSPDQGLADYASMQERLNAAYAAAAAATGASLAPVGSAWAAAHAADPGLALWQDDGSHPSAAGTYLAACVFYAALTARSPIGLPAMAGVPAETAEVLQRAAATTVLGDPSRWRIPAAP